MHRALITIVFACIFSQPVLADEFNDFMAAEQQEEQQQDGPRGSSWLRLDLDSSIDIFSDESEFEEFMGDRRQLRDYRNLDRLATLNLTTSPLDSLDANAMTWFSLTQLYGKGSDYLGDDIGLDDYFMGRVGLTILSYYLQDFLSWLSHEAGHFYHIRETNPGDTIEISDPQFNVWGFSANPYPDRNPNAWNKDHSGISGLIMEELDAYYLIRQRDIRTFDDGINYLMNKFGDVSYHLSTNDNELYNDNGTLDPVWYRMVTLKSRGINLSRESFLAQMLVADLLSIQTWESLAAIINYLVTGDRTFQPIVVNVGSVGIRPPLISYYLTPNGAFYNASFFISRNSQPFLEVQVGTDADFIGDGRVNCALRIGAEYKDLVVYDHWLVPALSPFVYLNFDDSMNYRGICLGANARFNVIDGVGLNVGLVYAEGDLIENVVKGQVDGFWTTFGLEIRY